MPKYLWCVSYSTEGVKGVLKEGGTGRREAVEKLAANLGATIESFHVSFGEDDAYVIADIPDNPTAAAISLAVAGVGAARVKTVVLLTPEEIDEASKTSIVYRPPGK